MSGTDEGRYAVRPQKSNDDDGAQKTAASHGMSQYGSLNSLAFGGSSNSVGGEGTNTERLNVHGALSGLDQGALLRSSTDWTSFGNNSSMADELYPHSAGPSSHHNSPYYSLSEGRTREQEAATTFMDSFGAINHRDDVFAHSFASAKQNSEDRPSGMDSAIGLGAAFSTPSSSSRTQEQPHTFNSDNVGLHRRLTSSQPSTGLAMDMDGLEGNPMRMHVSPSPPTRTMSNQDSVRNFHRHARSMGQMGAELSGNNGHDGLLRLGGPQMTPLEGAPLMDRFGPTPTNRIRSQSSSIRSPSPSDRSVSSTAFVGTLSPHTSVSTMRHGGDSSVDTSIDSISNSVTSMSANPSRSSSTSDELLSIGTSASSKKSSKGKTRLRNIDRKLICEAARDDPKVRQEDLAARFGIERSTVSKTLKNKDKWLAICEESEGALIIKHRNGKFPELEAALALWAKEEVRKGNSVLDVSIKHRALEIAKESGLGVDSFKASVGWIEKFRDRHELPKPTPASEIAVSLAGSSKVGMSASHRKSSRKAAEREPPIEEQESAAMSTEEVDIAGLFPTPHVPLRSAPSSSSISNDETASQTTHETPKASKRHYDDMDYTAKGNGSSIDSSMAKLHFLQRAPSQAELLTLDNSPEMEPSVNDAGFPLSSSASKRRKGGGWSSSASHQQPPFGQPVHAHAPSRRARSDSQQQAHEEQQSHVTAAAVAAANEIRRIEDATAALQRNMMNQQTSSSQEMLRHSSSPMERSPFYRNYGQPSPSDMASPLRSHFGSEEQRQPPATDFMASVPFNDDRRVTLEEARESLNLVLAFIARQPANLSPSDYFVLGNLQGTLSALAGQNQRSSDHQQHQQAGDLIGMSTHEALYSEEPHRAHQ